MIIWKILCQINTLSDGDNTVIFKDRDGDYYVVTIN